MTKAFEKIARLAGKDPAKLLEEYNKTARVRGASTTHYVKTPNNQVPKDYRGYLFVNDKGELMTIPPQITRQEDKKVCVFHTAYQAKQDPKGKTDNKQPNNKQPKK